MKLLARNLKITDALGNARLLKNHYVEGIVKDLKDDTYILDDMMVRPFVREEAGFKVVNELQVLSKNTE